MFVYSSVKMEGDSAVRDIQINRFESQLSEINLLGEWKFCAVTFSWSRKAAINRLKDMLTKASIKVSIH